MSWKPKKRPAMERVQNEKLAENKTFIASFFSF